MIEWRDNEDECDECDDVITDAASKEQPKLHFPMVLLSYRLQKQFGFATDEKDAEDLARLDAYVRENVSTLSWSNVANPNLPCTYPMILDCVDDDDGGCSRMWLKAAFLKVMRLKSALKWRVRVRQSTKELFTALPMFQVNAPIASDTRFGALIEDDALTRMIDFFRDGRVPFYKFMHGLDASSKPSAVAWPDKIMQLHTIRRRLCENFVLHVDTSSSTFKAALMEDLKNACERAKSDVDDRDWEDVDIRLLARMLKKLLRTFTFHFLPVQIHGMDTKSKYKLHVEGTPIVADNPIAAAVFALAFMPAEAYSDWSIAYKTDARYQYTLFHLYGMVHRWKPAVYAQCIALVRCRRLWRSKSDPNLKTSFENLFMPVTVSLGFNASNAEDEDDDVDEYARRKPFSMFSLTFMRMLFVKGGCDVLSKIDVSRPDHVQYFERSYASGAVKRKLVTRSAAEISRELERSVGRPDKCLKKYNEVVGIALHPLFGIPAEKASFVPKKKKKRSRSSSSSKKSGAASSVSSSSAAHVEKGKGRLKEPVAAADMSSASSLSSLNVESHNASRKRAHDSAAANVDNGVGLVSRSKRQRNGADDVALDGDRVPRTLSEIMSALTPLIESVVTRTIEEQRARDMHSTFEDLDEFVNSPAMQESVRCAAVSSVLTDGVVVPEDDDDDDSLDGCLPPPPPCDSEEISVTSGENDVDDDDNDDDEVVEYKEYTDGIPRCVERRPKIPLEKFEKITQKCDAIARKEYEEMGDESDDADDSDDSDDSDDDDDDDDVDDDVLDVECSDDGEDFPLEDVDSRQLEHITLDDASTTDRFDASSEDVIVITHADLDAFHDYRQAKEDDALDYGDPKRETVMARWRELGADKRRALKTYLSSCVMGESYCIAYNTSRLDEPKMPSIVPIGTRGKGVTDTLKQSRVSKKMLTECRGWLKSCRSANTRKQFLKSAAKVLNHLKEEPNKVQSVVFRSTPAVVLCAKCRQAARLDAKQFYAKYGRLVTVDDYEQKDDHKQEVRDWYDMLKSISAASPSVPDMQLYPMKSSTWCALTGQLFYADNERSGKQYKYVRVSPHENAIPREYYENTIGRRLKKQVYFEIAHAPNSYPCVYYPYGSGTASEVHKRMQKRFWKEVMEIVKEKKK